MEKHSHAPVRAVYWTSKCNRVYNLLMLLPKAIPIQHKLSLEINQSFNIPLLLGYGYQTKGKGQPQVFFFFPLGI